MIVPTVGRKVWYRPSAFDKHGDNEPPMAVVGDQPLDATIVCVWGPRMVNLVVHDAEGRAYRRPSVTLAQDGDALPPGGRYCEWMPYQVGQAKAAS